MSSKKSSKKKDRMNSENISYVPPSLTKQDLLEKLITLAEQLKALHHRTNNHNKEPAIEKEIRQLNDLLNDLNERLKSYDNAKKDPKEIN